MHREVGAAAARRFLIPHDTNELTTSKLHRAQSASGPSESPENLTRSGILAFLTRDEETELVCRLACVMWGGGPKRDTEAATQADETTEEERESRK